MESSRPLSCCRALSLSLSLSLSGLDFPTCPQSAQSRRLLHHLYQTKKSERGFSATLRNDLSTIPAAYDPCEMSEETLYLNRADVRKALHVADGVGQWASCSNILNYNSSDVSVPMEPIYTDLLAAGNLRMVIFSGDDDSVCATLGTQHWMFNLLGADVTSAWTQWMVSGTVLLEAGARGARRRTVLLFPVCLAMLLLGARGGASGAACSVVRSFPASHILCAACLCVVHTVHLGGVRLPDRRIHREIQGHQPGDSPRSRPHGLRL